MTHRRDASLRDRMLFVVTLALVPALILILHQAVAARQRAVAAVAERALRLSQAASVDHEILVSHARQMVATLSRLPELRETCSSSNAAMLADMQRLYPWYATIAVIDRDGALLCSAIPPPPQPVSFADRDWFQEVMGTHSVIVSGFHLGRITAKPVIVVAAPILDDAENALAVVVASLELSWLSQLLADMEVSAGGATAVVDPDGIVLAWQPDGQAWEGRPLAETPLGSLTLDPSGQGVTELVGADGTARLLAYSPLGADTPSGYALVTLPRSQAYAQANRVLYFGVGAFILAAVFGIGWAWAGINRLILGDLKALLNTTEELADGNYDARSLGAHRSREMAQLASAFDRMAEALQEQHAQVSLSETRYRTLAEQLPGITYGRGLSAALPVLYISPQVEALLGYAAREWTEDPGLWQRLVHPADHDRVMEAWRQSLETGGQLDCEYRLQARDGRVAWVRDRASARRGVPGGGDLLLGVLLDISTSKRLELVQAALYEIASVALETEDADQMYGAIHKIIGRLIPADDFYIGLYDPASDLLSFPYHVDKYDAEWPPMAPGRTLSAYVLRTGQPLLANPEVFPGMLRDGEVDLVGTESVDWIGVPLRTPQGQTIGLMAVQTYDQGTRLDDADLQVLQFISTQVAMVIQRKQAEQDILELKDFSESVVNGVAEALLIEDANGIVTFVNPAMEKLLGYSQDELIGCPWTRIVPPSEVDSVREHMSQRAAGIAEQYESLLLTREGRTLAVLVSARTLTSDGEFAGVLSAFADISALKAAEAALREEKDRAERYFDVAGVTMVVLDRSGRVIRLNQRGCELIGFTQEEIIGRDWVDEFVLKRDQEGVRDVLVRLMSDVSDSVVHYQNTVVSRGLGERVIAWHATVLRDRDGRPVAVLGSGEDITERERLAEAQRELARMKDAFVADVSHQLRTPLASMMGFLELLSDDGFDDPEVEREFVARATKAAERLKALVDNLLDVHRLEAGRLQLDLIELDLVALTAETVESVRGLATKKNVPLEHVVPSASIRVLGDCHWLGEALSNLVENAIKYSAAGRRVLVSVTAEGDLAVVAVADQGPGIPAAALPTLFDKYHQVHGLATGHIRQGWGLGLALAKGIVEDHGGTITVESEEGKGSTFRLSLPRVVDPLSFSSENHETDTTAEQRK